MQDSSGIEQIIKAYILEEFLPGEDPAALQPDTALVTSGVLDSLATLKLVSFLEEQFAISIQAHETDPEYLDSTARIAALVRAKQDAPVAGR